MGGGLGSSTYFKVYIQRGPMVLLHIFQGVQLVPWGAQMLISIETNITITCDFPGGGGGVWTPYPPSGSTHGQCGILARICAASF